MMDISAIGPKELKGSPGSHSQLVSCAL